MALVIYIQSQNENNCTQDVFQMLKKSLKKLNFFKILKIFKAAISRLKLLKILP